MDTERYTFFWGGPFSQWHMRTFHVDGLPYSCAEQYMMDMKASLFKDRKTAELIYQATSPKEMKRLGRLVQGFDPVIWEQKAFNIVKVANLSKFSQNPDLWDLLEATVGTTLVEASPYDKVWGIGLAADDPRAQNRDTWQGRNLLGQALTQVRDELLARGRK